MVELFMFDCRDRSRPVLVINGFKDRSRPVLVINGFKDRSRPVPTNIPLL